MAEKNLPKEESNRNVYCVDDNYKILWQIDVTSTGFNEDPFVYISFKDGFLTATNYSGFRYKVNLENGKTECIGWDK